MLLDAGEGTFGQMFRVYGPAAYDLVRTMSCVYISHMHADHHLGLVRILQVRQQLEPSGAPLTVIGPAALQRWLQDYCVCQPLRFEFVEAASLVWDSKVAAAVRAGQAALPALPASLARVGLASIRNVPVIHCQNAYGVVLRHGRGWSLVYSGDTRPCPDLVDAGQGATVLIHEATFENTLESEARNKRHSTTDEAIRVGLAMHAGHTMLTHFSQRYPKIPVFEDSFTPTTSIAFDCMTVQLEQLSELPRVLSGIKTVFKSEYKEEEQEGEENADDDDAIIGASDVVSMCDVAGSSSSSSSGGGGGGGGGGGCEGSAAVCSGGGGGGGGCSNNAEVVKVSRD